MVVFQFAFVPLVVVLFLAYGLYQGLVEIGMTQEERAEVGEYEESRREIRRTVHYLVKVHGMTTKESLQYLGLSKDFRL